MENLSYAAISIITGMPVCAVMWRLGLARARLAWQLERQ
jgi:DNA-directed RNA polymerase specialized sigma24 family protein